MRKHQFRYSAVVETVVVFGAVALVLGVVLTRHDHSAIPDQTPEVIAQTGQVAPASYAADSTTLPVEAGEVIPFQCGAECELVLRAALGPSLITQADAQEVVARLGIPFAKGGEDRGYLVSVQAAYGFVTIGYRSDDGQWMNGPLNVTLPDGRVLDQVEDRLAWILNYHVAPSAIPGAVNAPPTDHVVYVIDAESRSVLRIFGYAEK